MNAGAPTTATYWPLETLTEVFDETGEFPDDISDQQLGALYDYLTGTTEVSEAE